MQTLYQRVAGLDIHKETVVACVRLTNSQGQAQQFVRTFGTMTADLLGLSDWLSKEQITHTRAPCLKAI